MPYPKTMAKDEHTRVVTSPEQETRLAFDGWRDQDAPPVERGAFLPPVTPPPVTLAGPPEGTSAEASTAPPEEPAKRRRRTATTDPSSD